MRIFSVSLLFSVPFSVVALATAPGSVIAGEGCSQGPLAKVRHLFETADADADGQLSPAEYEEAQLERFGVSFEESDLDGDGATSMGEYIDLYRQHHPPADQSPV